MSETAPASATVHTISGDEAYPQGQSTRTSGCARGVVLPQRTVVHRRTSRSSSSARKSEESSKTSRNSPFTPLTAGLTKVKKRKSTIATNKKRTQPCHTSKQSVATKESKRKAHTSTFVGAKAKSGKAVYICPPSDGPADTDFDGEKRDGTFVARAKASIAAAAAEAITKPHQGISVETLQKATRSSFDQELIQIIAETIHDLRALSTVESVQQPSGPVAQSGEASADTQRSISRTSTQKRDLRRFSREIQRYVENTDAYGRVVSFSPTERSDHTLHTISALMPYRNELRAAGLAVTSKDQAEYWYGLRPPNYSRRLTNPQAGRLEKHRDLSQLDGKHESRQNTREYPAPSRRENHYLRSSELGYGRRDYRPRVRSSNVTGHLHCLPCFQPSHHSSTSTLHYPGQPIGLSQTHRMKGRHHTGFDYSRFPHPPLRKPKISEYNPDGSYRFPPVKTGHRQADQKANADMPAGSIRPAPQSQLRRRSYTLPQLSRPHAHPQGTFFNTAAYYKTLDDSKARAVRAQDTTNQEGMHDQKPSKDVIDSSTPWQRPLYRNPSSMPDLRLAYQQDKQSHSPAINPETTCDMDYGQPDKPLASRKKATGLRGGMRKKALKRQQLRGCVGLSSCPAPLIPVRISSIRGSLQLPASEQPPQAPSDRDVFRGLKIAIAAVANVNIGSMIKAENGVDIPGFLAGLVGFKKLIADMSESEICTQLSKRRSSLVKQKKGKKES